MREAPPVSFQSSLGRLKSTGWEVPKTGQVRVAPGLLMLSTRSVGRTSLNSLPNREAGCIFILIFVYSAVSVPGCGRLSSCGAQA